MAAAGGQGDLHLGAAHLLLLHLPRRGGDRAGPAQPPGMRPGTAGRRLRLCGRRLPPAPVRHPVLHPAPPVRPVPAARRPTGVPPAFGPVDRRSPGPGRPGGRLPDRHPAPREPAHQLPGAPGRAGVQARARTAVRPGAPPGRAGAGGGPAAHAPETLRSGTGAPAAGGGHPHRAEPPPAGAGCPAHHRRRALLQHHRPGGHGALPGPAPAGPGLRFPRLPGTPGPAGPGRGNPGGGLLGSGPGRRSSGAGLAGGLSPPQGTRLRRRPRAGQGEPGRHRTAEGPGASERRLPAYPAAGGLHCAVAPADPGRRYRRRRAHLGPLRSTAGPRRGHVREHGGLSQPARP